MVLHVRKGVKDMIVILNPKSYELKLLERVGRLTVVKLTRRMKDPSHEVQTLIKVRLYSTVHREI